MAQASLIGHCGTKCDWLSQCEFDESDPRSREQAKAQLRHIHHVQRPKCNREISFDSQLVTPSP